MILHLEDWKRFPNAIPHLSTKNKSWVELAHIFKNMGVKNYYFHLALLNPELEHVDPRSPDLTDDQKFAIMMELEWNPWYYFREYTRLPAGGGGESRMFGANRGNIAFLWGFFNNVTVALMMVRQFGKTTVAEQLVEWILDYGTRDTELYWITRSAGLVTKTMNNIKVSRSLKPAWADMTVRDDADNALRLTRKVYNNSLEMKPASSSKIGAEALGRGHSAPAMMLDEAAFLTHLIITLGSALPGLTEKGRQAKAACRPHGLGMVTTAGDISDPSGAYYHSVIYGGLQWNEELYDIGSKELLTEEVWNRSTGTMMLMNIVLNHRQLGKTDRWLLENIRITGGTEDEIKKNWFNEWGTGGVDNPLTLHVQDAIHKSTRSPDYLERIPGYRSYVVKWYKPKDELDTWLANNKLIVGLDTSNAIGRDAITMIGLCPKSLETVMTFEVNEANLHNFTNFLAKFLIRHDNAILVPENKLNAKTIIDSLLVYFSREGINPYTRIYNEVIQNGANDREEFNRVTRQRSLSTNDIETAGNNFGYKTSGSGNRSRDVLYDSALSLAASRACKVIHDDSLATELLGLRKRNGRIDHATGSKDDHVVAWLLVNWFLNNGKNLDVYGVSGALSRVVELDVDSDISGQDYSGRVRNENLKSELEELLETFSQTRCVVTRKRLEVRIRKLDNQISDSNNSYESIDQLLRDARNKPLDRIRSRGR